MFFLKCLLLNLLDFIGSITHKYQYKILNNNSKFQVIILVSFENVNDARQTIPKRHSADSDSKVFG